MIEIQEISCNYLLKFAESGYLHAIIDSCDSPAVPPKMADWGAAIAVSLFKDSPYEEYAAVAPYLVTVGPPVLEWMIQALWGQPWGIMVLSKGAFDVLANHLRRFLFALLPDGNTWYFRYYDPRTLLVYLSTCTQPELAAFFGPVHAYVTNAGTKLDRISLSRPVPDYQPVAPLGLWPVRIEQIHALDHNRMQDFISRISAYLFSRFPERIQAMHAAQFSELIQRLLHRGMSYGISRELDLLRYVSFAFSISAEFDCDPQFPMFQQVLRNTTLTGEQKMDRLSEMAAFREEIPARGTT